MWTGIILILSCSHGRVEAVHGGVPHTSPAAAAVIRHGKFPCSGTILSETAVLTDGFMVCGGKVDVDKLSVVVGENNVFIEESDWTSRNSKNQLFSNITQYKVKRIIDHPDYDCVNKNGISGENGLAILVLKDKLPLVTAFPRIQAATLPNPDRDQAVPGTAITVGGWGQGLDKQAGRYTAINTTIQPDKTCAAVPNMGVYFFHSEFYVPGKLFCAGNKTASPCYGDQGAGAMVYRPGERPVLLGVIVGVVHNDWSCGVGLGGEARPSGGYPAPFVSIDQHATWIKNSLNSLDSLDSLESSASAARFYTVIFLIFYF